jgi:hypothetical protein
MGYLLEYAWSLFGMHRDCVSCSGAVFCAGAVFTSTGAAFRSHRACIYCAQGLCLILRGCIKVHMGYLLDYRWSLSGMHMDCV